MSERSAPRGVETVANGVGRPPFNCEGVGECVCPDDTSHVDKAIALVDRVAVVLRLLYRGPRRASGVSHGFSELVERSFRSQATSFLVCESEVESYDRSKQFVCFFMAEFCHEKLETTYVPRGAWKRWASSRMRSNPVNATMWQTVFCAKRCAEAPSDEFAPPVMGVMERTIRGQHADLSKVTGVDESVALDIIELLLPLLDRIRDAVTDASLGDTCGFVPPDTSCIGSTKDALGKFASLVDLVARDDERSWKPRLTRPKPVVVDLPWFRGYGAGHSVNQLIPGMETSVELRSDGFETLWRADNAHIRHLYREHESLAPAITITDVMFWPSAVNQAGVGERFTVTGSFPEVRAIWDAKIMNSALRHVRESRHTEVHASYIVEPLKVRGITKDHAASSHMVTWFQKACFGVMRDLPCFPSFRRQIDATDLITVGENAFDDGLDWGWCSSDYSNASAGTSRLFASVVIKHLTAGCPLGLREIVVADDRAHDVIFPSVALRSRTGHVVQETKKGVPQWTVCPECEGASPTPAKQRLSARQENGTLMGQKTSFILLCLLNLGVHLFNLRQCGDTRDIWDMLRGVIINGDDRLTMSPRWVEDSFWSWAAKVGLYKSKGKSYFSQTYANINSQSYWNAPGSRWVYRLPVLNSGLLFGKKKLALDEFDQVGS